MNIIQIRSPYIINIGDYGVTQTGSKITISIYQKGTTPPVSGKGFFTLSKPVVSPTQRATYYNISNYIKEFINITDPETISIIPEENIDNWVKAEVSSYWTSSSGDVLIQSVIYDCVNGFNSYLDNQNYPYNPILQPLIDLNQIRQIPFQSIQSNDTFFNVMSDFTSYGQRLDAEYNAVDLITGVPYSITIALVNGGQPRGVYNLCVPLSLMPDYNYPDATTIKLKWYGASGTTPAFQSILKTQVVKECKYTPVQCAFINRFGGWEFLNFFKASRDSISVKGTDYKFSQNTFIYNTKIGQFKKMNINGRQSIKLNTGWVDENYSELIQDLLLSEIILLDSKPVTLKTQSVEFKTNLRDKNINYEIEFEYAYNLINDVI